MSEPNPPWVSLVPVCKGSIADCAAEKRQKRRELLNQNRQFFRWPARQLMGRIFLGRPDVLDGAGDPGLFLPKTQAYHPAGKKSMNRWHLDDKFWKVGKIVVIIDSKGNGEAVLTTITKIGQKYVTALSKRFYVMGSCIPRQIGSAKLENPLVLYTMEQISELVYMPQVQSALLKLMMGAQLLQIGDVLGIERPQHLRKVR
ncbi:hypothetical protein M0R72_00745 [Candidatus Pacearchaeota archaeon]|nr:hypothetical protein [Candidatus Pacearchaeota archaeon]